MKTIKKILLVGFLTIISCSVIYANNEIIDRLRSEIPKLYKTFPNGNGSEYYIFCITDINEQNNSFDVALPGWVELLSGDWTYVTSNTIPRGSVTNDYYGAHYVKPNYWVPCTDDSGSYWYYINSEGIMQKGGTTSDGYKLDSNGRWMDNNGNAIEIDPITLEPISGAVAIDPIDSDPTDHTGETGEIITPTCLLSSLPQIGGENYQIDLFGIYMSRAITSDSGNKEFLTNKTGPENFEEILRCAKYDSNAYSEFIEKLRKILKISERFFSAKDTMVIDKDAQQARVERNRAKLDLMHNQLVETILRIFGLLLIVYGFLIAIAGAVDESGIVNRSCTAFLTREKISQENPLDIVKKAPEDLQFRFSYIISALLIVTLGVICISPAVHQFIIEKILWIINGIREFFKLNKLNLK